ncbi:MAG: NAD(P)-dependent oxidoreductase [Oscillospiraceae bacterium]
MKIVVLEPLGIDKEILQNKIINEIGTEHELVCYDNRVTDDETLIERSKDADVVVLSNFQYRKSVIENCKNLKMICVAFTGTDHIDVEYCNKNSIMVCNCAGYSTVAVADIVFAMVINLARNIIKCDRVCRNNGTKNGLVGFELAGKNFGIIGCGEIGTRVAKIAKAFGCNVFAFSRTPKTIEGIKFVSMNELLEISDIISIHVPQNKETINLIGEKEFDKMKSSAILINTARGPIVNEEALTNALKTKKIAAAGIDVFDVEPPISEEKELFKLDNVVVTPHIAFASNQAFEKRADIVAKNISLWLDKKPQNIVK